MSALHHRTAQGAPVHSLDHAGLLSRTSLAHVPALAQFATLDSASARRPVRPRRHGGLVCGAGCFIVEKLLSWNGAQGSLVYADGGPSTKAIDRQSILHVKEEPMRGLVVLRMTMAMLACLPMVAGTAWAQAQGLALSGKVVSDHEGSMEGVLVSARKIGSTITVTVVSDAKGEYSFPASRLEPGRYTLAIRAAGYALDAASDVDLAPGRAAVADLKLVPAQPRPEQIANAEWMTSAPGPDEIKRVMLNCTDCHTLQRIFESRHTAADFLKVFDRMAGYYPGASDLQPQRLVVDRTGVRRCRLPSRKNSPSTLPASTSTDARRIRSRSSSFRAPKGVPPRSSSPNTICRGANRAPRRDRRFRRDGLVLALRRAVPLEDGPEDGEDDGLSDPGAEA